MSRFLTSFVLLLLSLPLLHLSAQEEGLELIEAHKQAVNPGALANAQVLKWIGTESTGDFRDTISFELLQGQEGKWQTTRVYSGNNMLQETFTGENGWSTSVQGGQVSSLMDFEFETPAPIARMSQWGSFLAKAEEFGYEPEYLGQKRDGSSMVHEFRMTGKNYDGFMLYLDANTNMVAKIRDKKIIKGRQASVEIAYSDYRDVEGAILPFRIETIQQGEVQSVVQFETLEINPDVPEGTWEKPLSDRARAMKQDGGRD